MDLSSKYLSFLFLLNLLFSLQIHARENFSKYTHVGNNNNNYNNENNNNNANDTELPNKVEPLSKQQEEPNFTPQTQNGYGLYGHDSSQLTPTTTDNNDKQGNNNGNYFYNKNEYEDSLQEDMTDTSLLGNGYTTPISNSQNNYYSGDTRSRYNTQQQQQQQQYNTQQQQENNNVYNRYNPDNQYKYNAGSRYDTQQQEQQQNNVYNRYNPNNQYNVGNRYYTDQQQNNNAETRYNTEQQYYSGGNRLYNMDQQQSYNGGNRPYNTEKKGMSDTRYMENGKFYYDINGEKNYRNGYDNKGYYGINENSYEFDKLGEENQNGYP